MMNTMKKYILGFVIAVCLWACSKEDWPSNDQLEVNFFAGQKVRQERKLSYVENFLTRRGCICCLVIHWDVGILQRYRGKQL